VVVFESDATTLVAGDTNGMHDVFLRDRLAGTTERISVDSSGVQGNGVSYVGSCSADGRIVAFASGATNLVSGDGNGHYDVFVRDRSTGITELVSLPRRASRGNADSFGGSLSPDGRFVVFTSVATNFVAGDTNGFQDVFVRDRSLGVTRARQRRLVGRAGNGDSFSGPGPLILERRFDRRVHEPGLELRQRRQPAERTSSSTTQRRESRSS